MTGTPPTVERLFPAPPSIRAEIEALARAWLRDDRPLPGLSADATRWIDACWTCLFRGALWIAEGGFVRRLKLPEGGPTASGPFPMVDYAGAAASAEFDDTISLFYELDPRPARSGPHRNRRLPQTHPGGWSSPRSNSSRRWRKCT